MTSIAFHINLLYLFSLLLEYLLWREKDNNHKYTHSLDVIKIATFFSTFEWDGCGVKIVRSAVGDEVAC